MTRTIENEAKVVVIALRQLGVNPVAAADNPMMKAICRMWVSGELDNDRFAKSCDHCAR